MPEPAETSKRLWAAATGAICVLFVVFRLSGLADSCLWFDEIFSVHAAEHDWSGLFRFVAQDLIHPPLFYVLLKLWIGLGGESVFWLRLMPVMFSVLAIFPFVRLCKELRLRTPVIVFSLALLAANGALIKYPQTLRMYSMLMFLALVSMWLFARYFNRGKSFVPLVIANVLLVYTHYFGWLVIGSEVAALLIFQRIKWRRAAVMVGIVSISFFPWFVAVWQAARQGSDLGQNIAWQPRPGHRELLAFALDLVEPFYFQASNAEPASVYLISIPLLLIFTTMLVIYFIEWKREEQKQSVYLLLLFVGLPFITAFAASWLLPHSVWGTRHLIIVVAPAVALLANAVLSFPIRVVRVTVVSLILVLCAIGLLINARRETPRYVWCAWNDVASDIRSKSAGRGPSKIYVFENLVAYHLWFALRESDGIEIAAVKGIDVRTDDETYFLPRGFTEVLQANVSEINEEDFWLAFRTSAPGEEALLIENFRRLGYTPCAAEQAKFDATIVFWIRLERQEVGCR